MKATIEFNLPDDDYSYRCSYHSVEAFGTIDDLCAQIRGHLKHGEPADSHKLLDEVYSELVWLRDLVQV